MRQSYFNFSKQHVGYFFEAIGNIFIFLPYFFSVSSLLKTIFHPWKNLISRKTGVGFSFEELLSRLFFNFISRIIGFVMRLSILISYTFIQLTLIIAFPVILIIFIFIIPLLYIESLLVKTEQEKKQFLHDEFIKFHLLKDENKRIVEHWFDLYYQKHIKTTQWWKLSNLFSYPPLARDWAVGFTPTLDEYADDLTESYYQLQREHIIDRQNEILQIEQILTKSEEANILLVGDEGVGKHTIVDALAKKIYEGRTNTLLMYKRILKLNMEKILTQHTDQNQREYFLDQLLEEASSATNCIILIDDFEKYVGYTQDHLDLTLPICKYAKSSKLQFIGITNPFSYQRFIMSNEKINRLFTKVSVYEIKEEQAQEILLDNAYMYEKKHKVYIPYETIHEIIDKSSNYITNIPFPEKAVHLLDSSCSFTVQHKDLTVLPRYVNEVLSQETHIPTILSSEMKEKLVSLESLLMSEIIQQNEAIQSLSSALKRSFILLGKRKKPIASFLFLGPTGVGKTQTAKAISRTFFGSEQYLLRFDMSLFQSKQDIGKLVGSIEANAPGQLTSKIREQPYGVLLLDEIEKANTAILNIFLTILDEGYFIDGYGKKIDCKNLLIIATSNAAASEIYQSSASISESKLIDFLVEHKLFSPEFLNRFDGIIVYKTLSEESVILIAKKIIDEISESVLKQHKIILKVSNEFIESLARKGYDPKFGARNMIRIIRNEIENNVAKMIIENKIKEKGVIRL